jgi:hypothetical protein
MRKLLISVAAASAMLAAPHPTVAATINYVFNGATATTNGVTEDISGTFTFDTSTYTPSRIDITVTGTYDDDAGTYTAFSPFASSGPSDLIVYDPTTGKSIVIDFAYDLANAPDPLSNFQNADGTYAVSNGSVGGAVDPTPLPAALPLFATGLGAMGMLGWRRKRKNAAIAA